MSLDFDTEVCPPGIADTLFEMGYKEGASDPNTGEPLFQIDTNKRQGVTYPLTDIHFRWYEALAYEFANFLTIGNV